MSRIPLPSPGGRARVESLPPLVPPLLGRALGPMQELKVGHRGCLGGRSSYWPCNRWTGRSIVASHPGQERTVKQGRALQAVTRRHVLKGSGAIVATAAIAPPVFGASTPEISATM